MSGGPDRLSGHLSETAVSCNSSLPVFGQLEAAFFVNTNCVPVYAEKSEEEYDYMLLPSGCHHSVYFINRETQMQAPMQMLGLCL